MKFFFFKLSKRRAIVMHDADARVIATDGAFVFDPQVYEVGEVDARLANRLTVALNEAARLGSKAPARMRWIVRDFVKHRNKSSGPWLPAEWHLYAIGEVPTLNSTSR